MNTTPKPRLFQPGTGALPPTLAGRDAQQAVLSRCLADLVAGGSPPHDVVLLGPRGNGKTALLTWFKGVCEEASVDALALTPERVANQQALVDALAPKTGVARWLARKAGVASVASAEWQAEGPANRDLVPALIARCRKRPLAVLLDEAHTLAIDVGRMLLNASQQVRADAPFLLVLAGTPGLPAHFRQMDASFWSRLGEGLQGVGRLDDAAAREALTEPLAGANVAIDERALSAVVDHSQRYSYFVQVWGDALWQHHQATGEKQLAMPAVDAARPHVLRRMADYYQERYEELRDGGLLPAAMAVAPLFRADPDATTSEGALDAALATAGIEEESSRLRSLRGLTRLGYVWHPPGQVPPIVWSAGIPSLTTFVLEAASKLASPR